MRFKRSYLEVLVDDNHITDVESELSKGEWFVQGYNPDNEVEDLIASRWLEQLTIIMLSKKSTEEQKERSYIAQGMILEKGGYSVRETEKVSRSIPTVVKNAVKDKYNNKCAACNSVERLHFHHIIRFADGGPHSVENLMLLCHPCHAKEHEGERGGGLLKGGLSTEKRDTYDRASF